MITVQTQGESNSQGNVVAGGEEINGVQPSVKAGSGGAGGESEAIGSSNAFIGGPLGAATAGGSSGGNSSALAKLSIISDVNGLGIIESVGKGIGASGGTGVFGPSLAAAIAAATPTNMTTPANTTADTATTEDQSSKNAGKTQAATEAPVEAQEKLVFSFLPGLPTGGGGGGFGMGTGNINVTVVSTDKINKVGEASGGGFANGFGFGVGSGAGQNDGFESAGGSGGGTALGQGTLAFDVEDLQEGSFTNGGTTTSVGGSAGYVGYNPVLPKDFFDELLTIRSPTPVLAGANGASAGGGN